MAAFSILDVISYGLNGTKGRIELSVNHRNADTVIMSSVNLTLAHLS